jgi:group I intron endonuclease
MLLEKDQSDQVIGEIYKITNTITNKCYVGQTRSHRLNHSKYRPFGHKGRFTDHINEAHSTKKNQSWYLNSAILKYGAENFQCELLTTCQVSDLNEYEALFILENNSKYPNGYNISSGGKGSQIGKRKPTPEHVKQKISESIKKNHWWNSASEDQKEKSREIWRANNQSRIGQKRNSYNNGLFKKTIWINNGEQRKRVPDQELSNWLAQGWNKGSKK